MLNSCFYHVWLAVYDSNIDVSDVSEAPDQSEASIQVMWSLSTNQRPVLSAPEKIGDNDSCNGDQTDFDNTLLFLSGCLNRVSITSHRINRDEI